MSDPYQQGGPQYGPPGTGPDLSKSPGAPGYPSQPQAQPYPSQPYGSQPYASQPQPYPGQSDPQYGAAPGYGQPDPQYGVAPGYGQPDPQYGAAPGYGQPDPQYGVAPGYGQPGPGYGAPMGYNPMDPEAPYGRDVFGVPLSDKQKLVAGLLQIFLGSFGVGRFYTGHTGIAVGQIAVTVCTCGTAGWVWGLIDGILMLTGRVTDSYGRPLRD